MIYHPRTPQEAVNLRKEHADTAVYLAGGTDVLRLGGGGSLRGGLLLIGSSFFLGSHRVNTSCWS